jgi:MFS family permease
VGSITALFGRDAAILRETGFQTLLLAAVLPPLGIALVSPVMDSLIGPFDTTSETIGLMTSTFIAPAIVVIPLLGLLADRYGRKGILVMSLVCFGAGGTAIAFTTDFRIVLALRLLQGVGYAGINPIIITSIGDRYGAGEEETAQGLRFMTAGLSGAVIPLVGGGLAALAWQYPFLVYAAAFPIAAGVMLWFSEPTGAAAGGVDGAGYLPRMFGLCRQRRVASILAARSLMGSIFIAFVTYNSLIVIRSLDGTVVEAGIVIATLYFTLATTASQAGRISALGESQLWPLVAANLSVATGFGLFLLAPSLPVALGGTVGIGLGIGILGAFYRSIITSMAPESLRGGLVSLSEAGGRVFDVATPLAIGAVIRALGPSHGTVGAIQLAGIGTAAVAGGGGIGCVLLARFSPPVTTVAEA